MGQYAAQPEPDAMTPREVLNCLDWAVSLAAHRATMLERMAPADRPAARQHWQQMGRELANVKRLLDATVPAFLPDAPGAPPP